MINLEIKPVLIVGAGPTGMTAAIELSRFGIPVRLVEKTPEPATTSRAVGVQARTLELLEQRGMADKMLEVGNKAVGASIHGGGKRIFRLSYSHVDSNYGYTLFISQAETERILREQLAQQNVTIERSVEMIAFAQEAPHSSSGRPGGVTATLRHEDGSLEEVKVSYMISAEGAHSTVRNTLGLEFHGKALEENYALGDLYVGGELTETDFHIFSSEHGFMGMFPMGDRRFRVIASNPLSEPSKDTKPELEELQKIYDMRSEIPAQFRDLQWSSWFRINSRMTDQLQDGQAFLGGDSAHIHSPAGAQGMNMGIQDMIDLGWKLAMVLQGKATKQLLATYGEDRLPVIHNVLEKTEGLTRLIGSENPTFRAVFAHVAPLLVGTEFVQNNSTKRLSQIGLNYRDSSLSETHQHHGSLRAGDRLPDLDVTVLNKPHSVAQNPTPEKLFSLINPSMFTLLYVNIIDPESLHALMQKQPEPWQNMINGYQIAPPAPDSSQHKHFTDKFGNAPILVLIRPDSYIGFTAGVDSLPKLVTYLKKWLTPDTEQATTKTTTQHTHAKSH
jgi:2-polyprenyl-6-methoxyphenol hydroxylase-like FAD-dependent oxidoreductase